MKPVCSIVIRAYNEEKHLGRLLEGISQQTIQDVQVILVDSGSTDNTVKIAKEKKVDIVNINPQDFTFGRSLNFGIEAAKSDLILIVSAHVYPVYPDWIEKMLEPFKNPSIALVYGKQRGVSSSQFSEKQIFIHWYPDNSQSSQDYPFCNNANAAIRKSLWKKNPYNELLPGLEDLAWAKWAQENNYQIAYIAQAETKHVHEESWWGIRKRYLREGMAFKSIYPHAHFTLFDFIHLFIKNSINDAFQAKREHVFLREIVSILRFRWQQFYGTYLGYRSSGPLTWQLKQSFYYPRNNNFHAAHYIQRDVLPIDYHKNSDTIE
ncbi:MAG: glycosyltransferase family 2 protein [Anaerolineaceae bacterium]|nr:glycosyltransferase family 2 protein [Anaerolineaceae bacterium]